MGEPMQRSEVVFMYGADEAAYRAFGATFVGWGGGNDEQSVRRHHEMGVRCSGTMWCLTAGAKNLHENPQLMAATARDIAGEPVIVPWLWDHIHEGTPSYFGCTNHPAYRQHVRDLVRRATAGKPDSLHVDDHLGVANAAINFGGGLCDCCIAGFTGWLASHADEPAVRAGLADAKAGNPGRLDYRDVIRRYASTREQYLAIRTSLPLWEQFRRFHLEAAAQSIRELGEVAAESAGKPVLLSANACLPYAEHAVVVPLLTHIICEVPMHAECGAANLADAIRAFEMADELGRPLAGTGHGQDWAWAKANGCHNLVRLWIALAYAHGQRFMAPHRQWCFTKELGTHWYQAPVEEFAPLYGFIRGNRSLFDGYERADAAGVRSAAGVLCTLRAAGDGRSLALHLLNTSYSAATDSFTPQRRLVVKVPSAALPSASSAVLYAPGALSQPLPLGHSSGYLSVEVPQLDMWAIVKIAQA